MGQIPDVPRVTALDTPPQEDEAGAGTVVAPVGHGEVGPARFPVLLLQMRVRAGHLDGEVETKLEGPPVKVGEVGPILKAAPAAEEAEVLDGRRVDPVDGAPP